MNIIFEGIDACGKTTIINSLIKTLDDNKITNNYIKEIDDSPLKEVLTDMLNKDPFFNSNKSFKTSIYETFILAAEHFYKQEFNRGSKFDVNIYDRDFMTLLCYQNFILEKEYGHHYKKFYESFQECILFDLKEIDLIVYVKVPINISRKRIEIRDNYLLNEEELDFLIKTKEYFETNLLAKVDEMGIKVIELDGEEITSKNVDRIVNIIRS